MIDMKIRNSSLMIQVFNYENQRGYKLVDAPVYGHNKEARERDFAIFIGG
jgi:3-hydroxyisobutyrate dehydrogenase-like beta-hydroxyacid dehydrogenase